VTDPVVIVGAGPVGMTTALELARHDVPSLILEAKPRHSEEGSRAIVLARHTLEEFARLGWAEAMLRKGSVIARARTYFRTTELFCVELPGAEAGALPQFMNLQQTYTERELLRLVEASALVEVRWNAAVAGLRQQADGVSLELERGGQVWGSYAVGCDGPHSTVRKLLGIEFAGKSFRDRFLIADIRGELDVPREERRFFFDPPFNPGRTALIHSQPDEEWRLDWQVPPDVDADRERASGALDRRIRRMIGERPYELVWVTAYRFHQRLAARFRVGRVFLAGDAAHLMSPFGARGMNSGVEDARNLGWKLALVWAGRAPAALLDTYEAERQGAAHENLGITGATMKFMAPPTPLHQLVRNAILRGSVRSKALRRLVNSGKLATPAVYSGDEVVGRPVPAQWRPVRELPDGFAVMDGDGYCLVRPDGYVAARLPAPDGPAVENARRAVLSAR
jgi:2-polyprenyl-6-methoxyphenol hydroxylase-like FAD-dependent oxidoreductase